MLHVGIMEGDRFKMSGEVEGYWIVYTYIICSDKFEIIKDKSCLDYLNLPRVSILYIEYIFLNEFCFNKIYYI